MYAVSNEAGDELVWFTPATAHEVIQNRQQKAGSEIIAKLSGKNKVEVSILRKTAVPEHESKPDNPKNVMSVMSCPSFFQLDSPIDYSYILAYSLPGGRVATA